MVDMCLRGRRTGDKILCLIEETRNSVHFLRFVLLIRVVLGCLASFCTEIIIETNILTL